MNRISVTDAVGYYKRLNSTWSARYNDPEYGPEILWEVLNGFDKDIVEAAIAAMIQEGKEYGDPDMGDICDRAKKLTADRDRLAQMHLPMCSMCARPETHRNHDLRRGNFAHPFTAPAPKRQNQDYTSAVAELRAATNRKKSHGRDAEDPGTALRGRVQGPSEEGSGESGETHGPVQDSCEAS